MTYLVTGAAGFIGSYLTQRLLLDGKEVVAADRFAPYYSPQLKLERFATLNPSTQVVNLDLSDSDNLSKTLSKYNFECVIHLAAQPGVRVGYPENSVYLSDNVAGFSNLLQFVLERKISKFMYASSSTVYEQVPSPFSESQILPMPTGIYARSKWLNEKLVESYLPFGLNALGMRFFSVYGPWGRPDMSYLKMFNSALNGKTYFQNGTGEALRDFTYISDAVEAIIRLDKLEKFYQPVVNIGGGHNRSMIEVRNVIEHLTARKIHIEASKQSSTELAETLASPEMLQKLTGFTPDVSIESGLGEIHEWIDKFNLRNKIQFWVNS